MSENVIIIAEAGVNHNGDLENAIKLIDYAKEAGVDYVKFQTFKASNLVSETAKKAEYQINNTKNESESQFEMLKKLELNHEQHEILIKHCNKIGIKFLSTAFDLESLKYLSSLNLDLVKIPSGEITNLPFLRLAAKLFKKVVISTGMSTIEDIQNCIQVFFDQGTSKDDIIILHCNTEYPTPMSDVNLKAMQTIGNQFGVQIGYSDHTLGIEVPIAAVALGAKLIEKHFTLDKNMDGPDHLSSLDPTELKNMVASIRNIELAISGNGEKKPSESESKNISIARKSIVASSFINKGDIFTEDNLTTKRPGTGISPMNWDLIVGKKAKKDFNIDENIEL